MLSTFNSLHCVQLNTMINFPPFFATNNLEPFFLMQIALMWHNSESVIVVLRLRPFDNFYTQFDYASGE